MENSQIALSNRYATLVESLADTLPKTHPRANNARFIEVARALGISTQAIKYRLENPHAIKVEHVLAAEMLLQRHGYLESLESQLAAATSAAKCLRTKLTNQLRAMT